jgi:hypothetical protein
MKCYLLTGAGFSRNWGGWLASEAFEYLLGDPAVIPSTKLKALLWKHQAMGGFEAALDELQRDAAPSARNQELQLRSAVLRMFDMMNAAFKFKALEFREGLANDQPVRNFLLRFKAIFSLNQDLLFEHCYRGSQDGLIDRRDVRTERDWKLPGMQLVPTSDDQVVFPSATGIWVPSDEHVVSREGQPIFKLHGSANWRSTEKSDMMILGGGKARAIERYPVLRWYSQVFSEYLAEPDTRLLIIGYGFRDEHINAALTQAIDKGLKIFVIDQLGADVAAATNSLPKSAIGYKPTALEESLQKVLIGASRRPLSSTFASDEVERQKIERFFLA